jgi:uncharacterized protein YegJ (DUF2314 family)
LIVLVGASVIGGLALNAQAANTVAQELKKGSTEPEYFQVPKDHHSAMRVAVKEARKTVGKFITALEHPGAGQQNFEVKKPFIQGNQVEDIWLSDVRFVGNRFQGRIDNQPRKIEGLNLGQIVSVEPHEISNWLYVDNGQLAGGYTVRVHYNELSPQQKQPLAGRREASVRHSPHRFCIVRCPIVEFGCSRRLVSVLSSVDALGCAATGPCRWARSPVIESSATGTRGTLTMPVAILGFDAIIASERFILAVGLSAVAVMCLVKRSVLLALLIEERRSFGTGFRADCRNSARAINATKTTSKLYRRIRLWYASVQPVEVRFRTLINPLPFTDRFYQNQEPRHSIKDHLSRT